MTMGKKRRRICIFCGKIPATNEPEHVVPAWLIELTGDPNRVVAFGTLFGRHSVDNPKRFAFDQFVSPSCKECNRIHGKTIEEPASFVVKALVKEEPASAASLDTLLDWLDKIRVGLWLAYYHNLSGAPFGFPPPAYVASQIGANDRMVCIYRDSNDRKGVTFYGHDSLAYVFSPYCFVLSINQFSFFNIAFPSICSAGLGLPSAGPMFMTAPGRISYPLFQGSGRFESPIVDLEFDTRCSAIFQSVWSDQIQSAMPEHYITGHVREVMDLSRGRSKLFLLQEGALQPYPTARSRIWIPPQVHHPRALLCLLASQVIRNQSALIARPMIANDSPAGDGKAIVEHVLEYNQHLLAELAEKCKTGYYTPYPGEYLATGQRPPNT